MTVVILHLSDIHIRAANDPILAVGHRIAESTYAALVNASSMVIIVSGDIAYSGTKEQYELAETFLRSIVTTLRTQTEAPVTFVLAPGNHDCDLTQSSGARSAVISALTGSVPPEVDDSMIRACVDVQEEYRAFRDRLELGTDSEGDELRRVSTLTTPEGVIALVALNMSWLSVKHDRPGALYFPSRRYAAGRPLPQADITLTVMHHPSNWCTPACYREFRRFLRTSADIVISGHEHEGNVGLIDEAETGSSAFVEGCVLQENAGLHNSAFNAIELDIAGRRFRHSRHVFRDGSYQDTNSGRWSEYQQLPSASDSPFAISNEFKEQLEDIGAFLLHPAKERMSLDDIYVYPDLRRVLQIEGGAADRRAHVNSDHLLEPEALEAGALLEGGEKSGATSLLYQLFRSYHSRGIVPLLITGSDLRKLRDTDLDKAIEKAVARQYAGTMLTKYAQLDRKKKLLLVDDFDDALASSATRRANLIAAMKQRAHYVVLTVGEMFEARELLQHAAAGASSLDHYQILPFGFARRNRLIVRWCELGEDSIGDDGQFVARCDRAERHIDDVMSRLIIPAYPLYLLALLQSIEAGRSGEFKESALGYYYQYLLTESLHVSGVRSEHLTELFHYLSQLAWFYHTRGKREQLLVDLREFNADYTKDWHTVDLEPRLDVLVRARILLRRGEEVSFRYPYVYYYLKGKYLGEHLGDTVVRGYISHCCKHLYVRDHANTVLFLAHHTNDSFLIDAIAESLTRLFSSKPVLEFGVDTDRIASLIGDAPKLVYSGGTPTANRQRASELKDELDSGDDGLVEAEEGSDDLSKLAQFVTLMKTTEILGQILKNKYAKFPRATKAALIRELFDAPLRALRDFYDFMGTAPESLVQEVEVAIQRAGAELSKEERSRTARRVVSGLVYMFTCGFIVHAARNANSDELAEDVHGVVRAKPTVALRMIELAIALDSAKPIPQSQLLALYEECGKDLVSRRVIEMLVVRRLYMFKTEEKQMQWLSEKLRIDIKAQHRIAYVDSSRRVTR